MRESSGEEAGDDPADAFSHVKECWIDREGRSLSLPAAAALTALAAVAALTTPTAVTIAVAVTAVTAAVTALTIAAGAEDGGQLRSNA